MPKLERDTSLGALGLPPPLSRSSSLGAQAASVLPIDLRDLALQLVENTELQDQTLQEIREGSTAAGGEVDDVDAYLWDFLETSQDLSEAERAALS